MYVFGFSPWMMAKGTIRRSYLKIQAQLQTCQRPTGPWGWGGLGVGAWAVGPWGPMGPHGPHGPHGSHGPHAPLWPPNVFFYIYFSYRYIFLFQLAWRLSDLEEKPTAAGTRLQALSSPVQQRISRGFEVLLFMHSCSGKSMHFRSQSW